MKKFPCVGIFTYHPEMKCNWVNLDDPARSFIAVHHLYKLGHRKIGFFTDTKDEPRTCDRFRGYLEALKYFGIRPNPDWNILFQRERIHGEYEMSPDPVPCRRELEIVFQKKNPPTSMILPSNWVLNGFRKERGNTWNSRAGRYFTCGWVQYALSSDFGCNMHERPYRRSLCESRTASSGYHQWLLSIRMSEYSVAPFPSARQYNSRTAL